MKTIRIESKEKGVDASAQGRVLIEALRGAGLRPGDFQGDGRQARLTAEGDLTEILKIVEQNTTSFFQVVIK